MATRRQPDIPAPDFFDLDLLSAAIRIGRQPTGMSGPRWDAVAHIFGIGSQRVIALCDRFGHDPYETTGH